MKKLVLLFLSIVLVSSAGTFQQLRFATTAQMAAAGYEASALSENPNYVTGTTYLSQVIPLVSADTVFGAFKFDDTVDVDIYVRHIKFGSTLAGADTSSLLDSLAAGSGGSSIVTKDVVMKYHGWYGIQWMLKFQTFTNVTATADLRKFRGNTLLKGAQ